jgi:hypothetical protein
MRETFTVVAEESVPPAIATADEHGGDDAMHEVEVTDINKRTWLRAVPIFAELAADDDFISGTCVQLLAGGPLAMLASVELRCCSPLLVTVGMPTT